MTDDDRPAAERATRPTGQNQSHRGKQCSEASVDRRCLPRLSVFTLVTIAACGGDDDDDASDGDDRHRGDHGGHRATDRGHRGADRETEATSDTAAPSDDTEPPSHRRRSSGEEMLSHRASTTSRRTRASRSRAARCATASTPTRPTRGRRTGVSCATSCYVVLSAVSDSLFNYDADGKPVPHLLESAEPNADYTEWTLTLRDGISFHDGTPLDGAAVKFNIETCIYSPLTAGAYAPNIEAVAAEGQTVTITTRGPWVALPHYFSPTGQCGYMFSPQWLGSLEDVPQRNEATPIYDAGWRRHPPTATPPRRLGSARSSTSPTRPATATPSAPSATRTTGAARTASPVRTCRTSTPSRSSCSSTPRAARTPCAPARSRPCTRPTPTTSPSSSTTTSSS